MMGASKRQQVRRLRLVEVLELKRVRCKLMIPYTDKVAPGIFRVE